MKSWAIVDKGNLIVLSDGGRCLAGHLSAGGRCLAYPELAAFKAGSHRKGLSKKAGLLCVRAWLRLAQ